ncbi:MAG: serine hydroxymethyltransferase, partial [Arsenophonus sp. NC-QC1-MAG3]
ITVNKNCVPNDPRSSFITSGIRIGSPAITRRGFKEKESAELANWICDILEKIDDESLIQNVRQKVLSICQNFPIYI